MITNRGNLSSDDQPLGPPKKRYRRMVDEDEGNVDEDGTNREDASSTAGANQSKAWQMMNKMGYKDGGGLGAQGQGRAEPINVQMRSRRRGLGAEVAGLEPSMDVSWDETQEILSVEETPVWIPECWMDVPSAEEMEDWIKVDQKKGVIDKETHFCSKDVLSAMIQAKSVFDELDDKDLRNARSRANPFESIKGAFFQNRAAMKMANLDAVFDDLFTNPKLANDKVWVPKDGDELLYFADICAGPGGFTEYVLWRRGWSAHGFGLTLRNKDDFRLDDFLAASPEMFEPFYGKGGLNGDGDITKPDNLEAFKDFVKKATGGTGVHTVMADGGFSVEGQENIQEILSKRLYLCQVLCAMNVLRPGGSFVCKLFDVFTPFSVGLIYLLWRSFDEVCLHKPHTSRPANSERYVICKRMRDDVEAVKAHLWNANVRYEQLVNDGEMDSSDIEELVPLEILETTESFFEYIVNSNESMARRQTLYLEKYKAFARNQMLRDDRQADIRARCLKYWNIPDGKRPDPPRPNPNNRIYDLCPNYQGWTAVADEFDFNHMDLHNQEQYRVLLRCAKPTIFLALGKRFIFYYEGTRWESADQFKLSIPRDTVLYAEVTVAVRGEGKGQIQMPTLRIFDAYYLAGEDVSDKPFRERRRLLGKFCAAICKESRPELARVCLAEAWHVEQLPRLRKSFSIGKVRGASKPLFHCSTTDLVMREPFDLIAQGFIIYRILKDEWALNFSKSNNRLYFFNSRTKESVFEAPKDAYSGFEMSHVGRKVWPVKKRDRSNESEGRSVSAEEETLNELLAFCDKVANLKDSRRS